MRYEIRLEHDPRFLQHIEASRQCLREKGGLRLEDVGDLEESDRPGAKPDRVAVEPCKPGRLKGRIRIGPDFDKPLPEEILASFRGEGE